MTTATALEGLDQVEELLRRLERLPEDLGRLTSDRRAEIAIRERTNNLFTMHLVGRYLAAVTLPALGKTAWISVTDPRRGTSGLGGQRHRFPTHDAALEHSRKHAEAVADAQATRLAAEEAKRLEDELQAWLNAL